MVFSEVKRRFDLRNNFVVARNLGVETCSDFKKMFSCSGAFLNIHIVLQGFGAALCMLLQQTGEEILAGREAVDFSAIAGRKNEKLFQTIRIGVFVNISTLLRIECEQVALREVSLFKT